MTTKDNAAGMPEEIYKKADDGEPAFPNQNSSGMTMRDHIATQALQGCLAYSHHNEAWGDLHNNGSFDDLAAHVYKIADAMLRERSK